MQKLLIALISTIVSVNAVVKNKEILMQRQCQPSLKAQIYAFLANDGGILELSHNKLSSFSSNDCQLPLEETPDYKNNHYFVFIG
jgi:hypothetical protein